MSEQLKRDQELLKILEVMAERDRAEHATKGWCIWVFVQGAQKKKKDKGHHLKEG